MKLVRRKESQLPASGLKNRLDKIDSDLRSKGAKAVYEINLLELEGAWRKGREVLLAYPELESDKPRKGGRGVSEVSFATIAVVTGRSDKTIASWVKLFLAHGDEKEFVAWAKGEAQARVQKWQAKLLPAPKANDCTTPLPPDGQFSVILADPPWRYDFSPTDSRQIENQYPTMEVEDICALGASMPFAEDAALFLWATAPKLREALQVLEAWGFTYKTHGVWDKEIIGMGYWFRGQHEPLLVATRGSFPPPPETTRVSSIIRSRRAAHSEKPEAVYELIENSYPEHPKLEMFTRKARAGWTPWGNEV